MHCVHLHGYVQICDLLLRPLQACVGELRAQCVCYM